MKNRLIFQILISIVNACAWSGLAAMITIARQTPPWVIPTIFSVVFIVSLVALLIVCVHVPDQQP